MQQGFLAQEARRANKKNQKLYLIMLLVFVSLVAILVFAVKDSIDLSDYRTRKLMDCLFVAIGLVLASVVLGLFLSGRAAADASKSLLLPYKEKPREEVAETIDREIAEGKVQVDEYIYEFSEGKKPYGERIILLPSYLLRCSGMGQILAIPRDKIYWVCAQVGRKGRSPFVVRLLIFTETKTFYADGVDVEHVEKIADQIYQYIPNVFQEYDSFELPYMLESLFDKDRVGFLQLYEGEKQKMMQTNEMQG